jgi:DNA-binding protein YbaB
MLYPGDWVTFFDFDSNGEIVTVDIEGNVHVLRVQIRTGWIMKAWDLATR